jgi:hypothetical protein
MIGKIELEKMYITEGLSAAEISRRLGVSADPILRRLHLFGIKVRPPRCPKWGDSTNKYRLLIDRGSLRGEHRRIMEKYLGRPLADNEIVHHVNHNRQDNRIENLMLCTRRDHGKLHVRTKWGAPSA